MGFWFLETKNPAILSQREENGQEGVIAYANRNLSKAERNYSVTERECLAVVFWIKYFRQYLIDKPFTVITDHQALNWLQKIKNPTGRIARWLMSLQEYQYQIEFRPGKKGQNVDALTRPPFTKQEEKVYTIRDRRKSVVKERKRQEENDRKKEAIEARKEEEQEDKQITEEEEKQTENILENIRKEQLTCPGLRPFIDFIQTGNLPEEEKQRQHVLGRVDQMVLKN